MKRRAFLALGLAAAISFGACAKVDSPVDPVWGKEPCAHCGMLVSDKRYAGQLAAGGERKYFDDIGCMALWVEGHGGRAERIWVKGSAGPWVDAKTARFSPGAKTPMDFGFAPSESGELAWDEVVRRAVAKSKGGAR